MTNFSRRNILKGLALGSAAVIFSPHTLLAATRQQKDRLGVALVGLGHYSTDLLAPALQQTKHCYLAGIVTGTPAKAETWKQKYKIPDKNIYNYDNFDQIANNPDIDVVYVVLPPSMHREYVVRAANAGKHAWCEKPMAMTAQECKMMIDACNKNKKSLAIGYRMQHEPTGVSAYCKRETAGQCAAGRLRRRLPRKAHRPLETEKGNGRRRSLRHGCIFYTGGTVGYQHGTGCRGIGRNLYHPTRNL
jgi:hypothetical protein